MAENKPVSRYSPFEGSENQACSALWGPWFFIYWVSYIHRLQVLIKVISNLHNLCSNIFGNILFIYPCDNILFVYPCDSQKSMLLFVASIFIRCIRFFINLFFVLCTRKYCEDRKNIAYNIFLTMRLTKINAPIRRINFYSLHKVSHTFRLQDSVLC